MSAFDWLIAEFPKATFVAFDTETTGLEPRNCRVVEIGAIRYDSRGIISRFGSLVNPGTPMPPEVTKVNGITDKMLEGQPSAAEVLPDFIRFIGDAILVAHNAPFDVSFINEELSRAGLAPLRNKVVDTRMYAKAAYPGLPNYKLQDLAARFGIMAIDAHRAEDDARVCMELFLACLIPSLSSDQGKDAQHDLGQSVSAQIPQASDADEENTEEEYEEEEDLFADIEDQ